MRHIEELRDVIWRLHNVRATHIASVPVKYTREGITQWEGTVEVFKLHGHPAADTVYAWIHDPGSSKPAMRYRAVLHIGPVTSAEAAVEVAMLRRRNSESEDVTRQVTSSGETMTA